MIIIISVIMIMIIITTIMIIISVISIALRACLENGILSCAQSRAQSEEGRIKIRYHM